MMRVRVLTHVCVSEHVSASEVGEMREKAGLACVVRWSALQQVRPKLMFRSIEPAVDSRTGTSSAFQISASHERRCVWFCF